MGPTFWDPRRKKNWPPKPNILNPPGRLRCLHVCNQLWSDSQSPPRDTPPPKAPRPLGQPPPRKTQPRRYRLRVLHRTGLQRTPAELLHQVVGHTRRLAPYVALRRLRVIARLASVTHCAPRYFTRAPARTGQLRARCQLPEARLRSRDMDSSAGHGALQPSASPQPRSAARYNN
jgi:hypothetical protein